MATMDTPELVVFDLAGTTVEDRGEVPFAFTAALAEHGVGVTSDQIAGVRGSSKRQALAHFIPAGPDQAAVADRAYASFRSHLMRRYDAAGVQPVAGAVHAFHWLRDHGIRVALNTGFDRETTGVLLAALGWLDGVVDAIVCGDDVKAGRPAPFLIFRAMEATGVNSVHRVAAVGDTTLDLQAGYHAGVRWNIGVLSGAHDRPALERVPHTHLLSSVADVTSLWATAFMAVE
jgi:phosphonatase-like hydrolase